MCSLARPDYDRGAARPRRGPPAGTHIREAVIMSDVKVERKESLSRDEAAMWLSLLSKAFAAGDHAELPFGSSSVSLNIPDRVRAELEVEVEGDEVEVEVEFKWSMVEHEATPALAETAVPLVKARQGNAARKSPRSSKTGRR